MKQKLITRLLSLLIIVSLFSCKNNKSAGPSKNITGNAGEMVVVISNKAWDSVPGQVIRQTMAKEHPSLPQDEPLFDLVKVPREGFKSIFKTARNIIQTRISSNVDSVGVTFINNVWASPQATIIIQARDEEEFKNIFNENSSKILSYFIKAERDRLTMNYNKYYERGIYNVLNKNYGVTMKIAPGFQIAIQEKNFLWLRYETPEISQGIILYTIPYASDSAFTMNYQIAIRDSLLKKNIKGPTKGSYMTTEKRIEQVYNIFEHNNNYASEMRGLWRLENDYMGGPYLSVAELDLANQRIVVAYGFVYAPSKDKRNLLRQVEAMLYTLKLNSQAENNKIINELNSKK